VVAYLAILAVAAIGSFLLTFPVRRLAVRVGAVVLPDDRRVHDRPTPTVGGAAMFVAFLVAMVVASQLPQFQDVFQGSSEPLGVVLGATVIFATGLVDDLREVSAPAKVAGMVLAACVLYFLGVTMISFKVPGAGVIVLSPSILPLLTALWVVGMANAINLIDGLDGLAAGIVAIAAGAFSLYSVHLVQQGSLSADNLGPLLAVIACGICLGFLPHNFHPARVFMGDTGALVIGLLMAASTSVVGGRTTHVSGQTYFFFAPLFIPFVILGVPILDTALAIIRRTARRSGIFSADKEHLHHRLLQMGHGHRRSVLILWAWTALLSAFVIYPVYTRQGNAIIPFAAAGLGVALYTVFRPGGWRRSRVARVAEAGTQEEAKATPLAEVAVGGARPGGRTGPLAKVIAIEAARGAASVPPGPGGPPPRDPAAPGHAPGVPPEHHQPRVHPDPPGGPRAPT
jgi:UDP-GlcNAc:undecaprenyl-phosphate GlcNAc-1-phosphate transferase